MGLQEQTVFPEIEGDRVEYMHGMDITICTTARKSEHAFALLKAMGMPSAFAGADFSGITGGPNGLFIESVQHEAFIAVDEDGTKAAAATGVAMAFSHGPTVTVDRPFLYVIRDKAAGTILFMGRVMDPSKTA